MSETRVVVVGAGQAGAQVAFSLRQGGHQGSITILGQEALPPYERPPLSKGMLRGVVEEDRLFLKTPAWYTDHAVDLRTGARVASIDREQRLAKLSDGADVPYDVLVLATGSRPRALPIPGANLGGTHDLRGMQDARKLRTELKNGSHLLVVGAGYIGLEVAAVARSLGMTVTVLEAMERVLARVAGQVVSEFFEAEHRAQGVDLRCGARLAAFEGDTRLRRARLADGTVVEADLALVGIGIQPCQELAEASGITCEDGIVVDRDARTSDPAVYAVGDCTRRPLVHYGRSGRLESVHNAIEQGKLAAASILGHPRPAEDVPWFWSDQYDLKLQMAGLSQGHDRIVLRGRPEDRRFAAFYLGEGRLLAVDAIGCPMEFMASRQLIAAGARPAPDQLEDPGVSMKAIVDAQRTHKE